MASTMDVAKKLVELCQSGNFMGAVDALYGPDIVSIEAQASPTGQMPQRMEGIKAVRGKSEWWERTHTVHSAKIEGPWPHRDRFIVRFTLDVTAKEGPMAGQRMTLDETGLYTVKDGKIVQEEFFYFMG